MTESSKERVKFWRSRHLPQVELLHAFYVKQSFSRHFHEGFALGAVEQGALRFSYRGECLTAFPGCVNLVIPGEAHDGEAAGEDGWTYRMFYLDNSLMERVVFELSGKENRLPFIAAGVLEDAALARAISNLHRQLESEELSLLEQESQLLTLLTTFVARYGEKRRQQTWSADTRAVALVKDYLEAMYVRNVSLEELSRLCGLSSFHMLRQFRAAVGVPPHAYLKQVRVRQAQLFLRQGLPLAYVAQETGFADQGHFSRQFKQITGVSPKQYSKNVQEKSSLRATMKYERR
ncbi:AraC family transcriptional regulator [Anaeromusa acidaminophila]|uniref:AraC family transcriptional regulator n=1 Tax=Anaeromusa acidaminophila TaxID=81464 RepID=UPI00036F7973|nr:AraC family transcriptional regulator [Anaeromusa acidaminophila]